MSKELPSVDQLMKLIKSHKLKIRKLETENEALLSSSKKDHIATDISIMSKSESSDVTFWDLIDRKSIFQQRLAKCAISNMLNVFKAFSHRNLRSCTEAHSAFSQWKRYFNDSRYEFLKDALNKSETANAASEQKYL